MARGPGYPFIDLEEATKMAGQMFQFAKKSMTNPEAVIQEAWKYSLSSSSGIKKLAALKYFGLVEEVETSSGKGIRITDRAYRILIDSPDAPERKQALRDAALSPRWYGYCWSKWGKDMPPSMRSTLLFEHGFVATTVDAFIADYKKSIGFAGLLDESEPKEDEALQGVDQSDTFPVNGSGVQSSQDANVQNGAVSAPMLAPANVCAQGVAMREDIFSLEEGPVRIQWPATLSRDSFEDLKMWLGLLERRIGRSVASRDDKEKQGQAG